eukprot:PITA_33996
MDKVVEEYEDIFTSPAGVPLHCQVKHSIDLTPGAPLPNGPIYQRFILENNEIKRQIQELLQKGHIRSSSSPYGSPIVLVQKKDGTWRLCIDYQVLNKIIVHNRYPIPLIDDLLDQLKGAKYFSKINLKLGYHQVPIEPSNVWKTTFKAKESLFEWLVMISRFMNAPTTFMRLMDDILRPFTNSFVVVYRQWKHYILGKETVIHTDHRPLQLIQTQGKFHNDHHEKWSTNLQQFHLNIKYKKGSTNNVADCLSQPPIMALTTVLNTCGHETSDWSLLYKSDPEFGHTY